MKQQLTHAEYCRNREKWLNAASFITPELDLYLVDGEYLTGAEFEEKYPVSKVQLITWRQKKHNKGENPNQSKNYS